MTSTPAATRRARPLIRSIAIAAIVAAALVGLALVAGDQTDSGHVLYHAFQTLVILGTAAAIALRWPHAGWASRAPVLGLLAFAGSQLVEGAGGFGFGLNGGDRNGLAVIHDLGIGLTALALIVAVLSLAAGLAVAAVRRSGAQRSALLVTAGVVGIGGSLLVKVMIGM